MNHRIKKIILLSGDICVLYISLYLTLFLRYLSQPSIETWLSHFWPFSLSFIAWIIIFYISDLYNLHIATNNTKFFSSTIRSILISALLSVVFFYANPNITIAPKTNLLIYIFIVLIVFISWRYFYNWILGSYLPKINIAIIGYNNEVKDLVKTIQNKPHLGFIVSVIIKNDEIDNFIKDNQFKAIIKEKNISSIILASDINQSEKLRSFLFSCLNLKINITSLPNFYEKITGKIPIEAISQMWFLENLTEGSKNGFNFFKRSYDILLALIILIITGIFWSIISFIIKKESEGPVFFTQTRAGKNGKEFKMIKFRTMRTDNNNFEPTKSNDIRVTKFGNFMRKTRIDELPQIINILKGEMSFVGPRPERPEFIKELKEKVPFYRERMLVTPGATGWDQVSGEYHSPSYEDTIKKLQYDLFYIKNRSIYLDLTIILKTISIIFKRSGL